MTREIFSFILLAFAFFFPAFQANASVVTFPAPSGGIPLSSDFTVSADGMPVDVYQVKVPPKFIGYTPCPSYNELASMAYFDFSGTVNVRINSSVPVSSVAVRPLRHNIQPSVSGNSITFSLSQPVNLSVEINGDDRHNLHLFANPMEQSRPSPSDPDVLYYGPGVHGNGSLIPVYDGQTVYIAGGAVVYGYINGTGGGSTAAIRGRGIVSGEKSITNCATESAPPLVALSGFTNISLEGFIAVDPARDWTFMIFNIGNLLVDNIKSIAWLGNGDGLNIVSVSNATIKNVFIRATDDVFAIKSDPYFFTPSHRPAENITFEDSVNWADGAGHAIAFMEQTTPYVRNVQFKNIDIIHTYVPAVWFSCCDASGEVYNITLDDVRVEDMQGSHVFLAELNSAGSLRNVHVNNFQILGGNIAPSNILGSVSNVTFNNLNYRGNILSPGAGQFTIGGGASNINFTQGAIMPPPQQSASSACHILDSAQSVPTGFGASYNVHSSARELLLKANCTDSSINMPVGNGSSYHYIYNAGYFWNGSQWENFTFSCSNIVFDAWCVGNTDSNRQMSSSALSNINYYVAYVCNWTATEWKCGCRDDSCATNYWNLQAFKR